MGVFGQPLSAPVQVAVLYRNHPVPGAPVRFRFTRGRGLLEAGDRITVTTDAQGIARALVMEVRSVTHRNVVAAVLDTAGLDLPTGLSVPECQVRFSSVLHPTAQTEGLHFSLAGSSSEQAFRDGETIPFAATTHRRGVLTLFVIDASGRLKCLAGKELDHPEDTPSWRIEPYGTGWRFTFPMVIRASSGRGLETLVGLWTDSGIRIGQPGQVYAPSDLWAQDLKGKV